MRLFTAIPVAGLVEDALRELVARCRSQDWPVKWVRPEGLHLTVKFLGPVEADRVAAIEAALAEASAGTPRLPFSLRELGAFPGFGRARVIWAGLESEAALELMVDRVERACGALGFPVEGRPFRPHVTLGRVREGRRLPEAAIEALERAQLPAADFLADRLVLFESRPGPGGSTYAARATFPLGT
jgi:RNA 2',3'-cyclic 3'-phosphodiesterase